MSIPYPDEKMAAIHTEPLIKVGLLSGVKSVRFALNGQFKTAGGEIVEPGEYTARVSDGQIVIIGADELKVARASLSPVDFATAKFTVYDVIIGINFHWERKETQSFQGALQIIQVADTLTILNELPLEAYLISVISSEMSASCPTELLRAHAIVSRSWLLAQLANAGKVAAAKVDDSTNPSSLEAPSDEGLKEIIKWYDRENHADFDVCADDHCQRYQGISKAFSPEAFAAVQDTRARVLTFAGEICDARYSKSCGGMSEVYRAAWEEKEVRYLSAVYDWQGEPQGYGLPLTVEKNAEEWIKGSPCAFCNTQSKQLLARILPGFDQETQDFYRWRVTYTQDQLQELLQKRARIDVGAVVSLAAIERGESGRIIRLKITGTKGTIILGKELEIRRALSPSHLYSSAFIVQALKRDETDFPEAFELIGAGWGHGVGLCQIGAAVMADSGFRHVEILAHYFKDAKLQVLYS